MTYLLDVNALLALIQIQHAFNQRTSRWMETLDPKKDQLATCSIVELGFIRILPQMPDVDYTVEEARHLLARYKAATKLGFTFLPDHLGADHLPQWVKNPGQTTDGHLVSLANSHSAMLATLDRKIPGTFLIPA